MKVSKLFTISFALLMVFAMTAEDARAQFTVQWLDIGAIRTDEGGEFEGEFQRLLVELSIKHEHTHPDTPKYNGVAERALGLLREKTIAMMQGFSVGADDKLWAEA